MAQNFDAVIFDLDGTLLNTLDDLTDSINIMLSEMGCAPRSTEEVRQFVGNGVALLVTRALPDGQKHLAEKALLRFMDIYSKNMQNKTRLYDGILQTLKRLQKNGVRLGVASNKPHDAVIALVFDVFGDIIEAAVGEGYGILPKPQPDMLLDVMKKLDAAHNRTLYVGDSEVDMQTARLAGVTSAGCTWGFRDRRTLLEAGADFLIDHPDELLGLAGIL